VRERRDDILAQALAAALDTVTARHGPPDAGGWRWDGIQHANIWHLLRLPALSALDLPLQGGPSLLNPSSGSGTFGASWRMVVELGPELRAWATYPGGQSGNPSSARYRDRLDRWIAGELDSLRVPRRAGALGRVVSTLDLVPARAR
jgi:penicillin amidase